MYIAIRELPRPIQDALASVGYGRQDVDVQIAEEVSPGSGGQDGQRTFFSVINLETGTHRTSYGSWGGSNMFVTTQADEDRGSYPLPVNAAVVKGSSGGVGTFATVYIGPANAARLLPAADTSLSEQEKLILGGYKCLKSGPYRQDHLRKCKATPAIIVSLVERGYLTMNKAGAVGITTSGRNAAAKVY